MLCLRQSTMQTSPPRLRELAQADEEGHIVVLPCKVGDTVYRIVNDAEPHKNLNDW